MWNTTVFLWFAVSVNIIYNDLVLQQHQHDIMSRIRTTVHRHTHTHTHKHTQTNTHTHTHTHTHAQRKKIKTKKDIVGRSDLLNVILRFSRGTLTNTRIQWHSKKGTNAFFILFPHLHFSHHCDSFAVCHGMFGKGRIVRCKSAEILTMQGWCVCLVFYFKTLLYLLTCNYFCTQL